VTVVPKESAGLLVFRRTPGGLEVLLAHPGGPFWAKKDEGAWSIPKGELAAEEDPLAAALREFEEETGVIIAGTPLALQPVRQPSGKIIRAWAVEGDLDPATVKSTKAPKRLRSAKAPLMSAGVMAANIIWNVAKRTKGMPLAPPNPSTGSMPTPWKRT